MWWGADTITPLTEKDADAFLAAHMIGAGRYLRNLKSCEVQTAFNAKLPLWLIAERGNPTTPGYFTEQQAHADREWAESAAEALGVPKTVPLFYTVDFSVNPAHASAILPYLQELMSLGSQYPVGIYGNVTTCWAAWNAGIQDAEFWVTMGNGSCGESFPFAKLVQIPSTCGNSPNIAGVSVDMNLVSDKSCLWLPT